MTSMRARAGRLRDHWYVAARSDEVTTKKPHGSVILEEPLVLFRTSKGRVVALEDRCAHRNAKLSEGDVFDDRLGCPYHGWTYDCEGRLVNVPSEGPRSLPVLECSVPRFHVLERYGLVWVWMGHGAPDGAPFVIPHFDAEGRSDEEGWGGYWMTTDFANGVTNLVENFMDVPHTVFVHKGWFRRTANKKIKTQVERTKDSVLVTYDQPSDSIGFTGRILNPSGAPMVHTDKFYMPNVTRVDYDFGGERGFVITSTCTPRGPFDTRVYTRISYQLGRWNRLARHLLPPYTREVIRQDVVIMRNQGDNLQRYGGAPRFLSTAADVLHQHIEALRDHATRGEDAPEPRVDVIEMWI
ncbi:aromatic ring-hydroxylating oxygenase subunit alpha [Sandaracinus amylolyticus]|uniref:Phenylpropionate dioxygenase n=1 Tax=Sandaracinus amylolyticus TaxID=927083 RepID=A0A0F6SF41_9BACT|nr:aromatic ring-hydroxylating dioxygenase subunit alpha [Sandaracinus amylolyticus]AKF06284.1 Phenylpropionate dioxygenase [Sandaracinus amylolyticus]